MSWWPIVSRKRFDSLVAVNTELENRHDDIRAELLASKRKIAKLYKKYRCYY